MLGGAVDYEAAHAWALPLVAETLGAGLFAIAAQLEGIKDQLAQAAPAG